MSNPLLGRAEHPGSGFVLCKLDRVAHVANCFPAPSLVLIGISGGRRPKADLAQDVALAAEAGASAPVVIFTDGEDVTQILEALDAA